MTLEGLPERVFAALRDARNLNFRQLFMGLIESTVAYGPVYFNTQPNLQLSLSDVNILDALTLNVKTHGYNYAPGSELICLSHWIYYKLILWVLDVTYMINLMKLSWWKPILQSLRSPLEDQLSGKKLISQLHGL